MKVNLNVALKSLDNTEVVQEGKPVMLSMLCSNALLSVEDKDGTTKMKCFSLASKIHASTDELEITVEEAAFLKDIIGKSIYTPLVIGRVFEILEG